MPGSFLDTNVLVYLAQGDPAKSARVEELLRLTPVISVQVLNELTHVLRRKAAFTWAELHEFMGLIRSLVEVAPLTLETHDLGLSLAQRCGLSTYDGMIVAAAHLAGCEVLWSEDMQAGLQIDARLRIEDPFSV